MEKEEVRRGVEVEEKRGRGGEEGVEGEQE